MDILTGAFRQGSEENLVVFSDEYFEKVQDDWKKYNWITGDPVEEGEAEEGVTIHHWPTKLVLLNVKNVDYQKIEKELQAFGRYIKRMKDLTRMYYPAIPNVQRWNRLKANAL